MSGGLTKETGTLQLSVTMAKREGVYVCGVGGAGVGGGYGLVGEELCLCVVISVWWSLCTYLPLLSGYLVSAFAGRRTVEWGARFKSRMQSVDQSLHTHCLRYYISSP